MDETNMLLIIALAIYDSIDVAVMAFLLALVVWYGSFFLHQVMRTLTIYWESKPLASGYK